MTRSLISSAFLCAGMAFGFAALFPSVSHAELIKLDLLQKSCAAKSAVVRADCEGYIAGVYDMLGSQHAICPSADIRLKNVREMAVGYLGSHKFPADTTSVAAVTEALKAGYACKKP